MSTDLTVRTDRVFDPAALPFDDLRWTADEDSYLLHRVGLSTRTTTVVTSPGEVGIEIRALAADADIDLAVAIAVSLGGEVEVEGVLTDDVTAWFGREMRDQLASSGARALVALLDRGPMEAPGPVRSFVFGRRLQFELRGPDFPQRLLERMRAVQWDVPAKYRDAAVFTIDGDRTRRLAIWIGTEDLVLPNVRFLVLDDGRDDGHVVVPSEQLPELAGEHARLLDECQWLVDAFTPEAWADVLERARAVAVDPRS